jgi:hypothetical protein
VKLHRRLADVQQLGYRPIGLALRQVTENFKLTFGQRSVSVRLRNTRLLVEVFGELVRHRWRQHGVPLMDFAYIVTQLLQGVGLQKKSAHTHLQCADHQPRFIDAGCIDDYPAVRGGSTQVTQ